jgi:hypothetical protein
LYRLYRRPEPGGAVVRLMRIKGELTMIRAALIAVAAIAATVAATEAAAQSGAPVRKLAVTPTGTWTVVRAGEQKISHCVMGVRSDAANPQSGKPQFMISADDQFVLLRVRAAEWAFSGARDITVTLGTVTLGTVTLGTAESAERQPAAAVRGQDMIDIAFGPEPERMMELAASAYLDIRAEGTVVRLPLKGLAEALPAYRECLASVGLPAKPQVHAVAVR